MNDNNNPAVLNNIIAGLIAAIEALSERFEVKNEGDAAVLSFAYLALYTAGVRK